MLHSMQTENMVVHEYCMPGSQVTSVALFRAAFYQKTMSTSIKNVQACDSTHSSKKDLELVRIITHA